MMFIELGITSGGGGSGLMAIMPLKESEEQQGYFCR